MRKISIILKAFIIIIALILVHSADAKDDVTAFSEQMKSTIVRIDYIPIGDWNDPPILCYMVESHYGLFSQHVNVWKDGRIAWFDALKGPAPVDDPQVKVGLYYYKSVLPRESIKNIMAKIIKARANNSLRNSKIRRQIPFVSDMCHAYFIDSEEFLADEKWSSLLVTQYQCNRNEILEFMKRNEISDAIDAFGRTLNYDKSFFTKTYADIAASMKDKGVTENENSAACQAIYQRNRIFSNFSRNN